MLSSRRRLGVLATALVSIGLLLSGSVPAQSASVSAAASNTCVLDRQTDPNVGYYALLTNSDQYYMDKFEAGWQTLKCSSLSFTVPSGQNASIVLRYSGTFDVGTSETAGWVQGTFRITSTNGGSYSTPLPHAVGNSRIAIDNGEGGSNDFNAHSFTQSGHAFCQVEVTCRYYVYVQGIWRDGADVFAYNATTVELEARYNNFYGAPSRQYIDP